MSFNLLSVVVALVAVVAFVGIILSCILILVRRNDDVGRGSSLGASQYFGTCFIIMIFAICCLYLSLA